MNQQPGNNNHRDNHGKRIGDIFNSAFSSGDLSRLKDLGPAVQDAVQDVTDEIQGSVFETRSGRQSPVVRQEHRPYWAGNQRPASGQSPLPMPTGPKLPGFTRGLGFIIGGISGMVAFGLCALLFGGLLLALPAQTVLAPAAVVCGAAFGGSAVLTGLGVGKRRQGKRLAVYARLFQNKQVYTFAELAAETGYSPKRIRKDLVKAKQDRLLPDIWFDDGFTCVMQGEEARKQYLDSEKNRHQRELEEAERQRLLQDPATAGIELFRAEGVETIRKIREANKALPAESISQQLDRLEATTGRVFSYVEKHPEKLPETRKFMSYYLPTTLKLVEKYQQFELMDYQPENVKEAKERIEKSLETIDEAFNNLLEGLYQHDTLDVATDIEVLEQMLEQEGLTGRRFDITSNNKDL